MKEYTLKVAGFIKAVMSSRSSRFLIITLALFLVTMTAKYSYDFGKEIGASFYFITHL